MTWTLIRLRGLEQFMLDMIEHPDELHRLMAFLRDGHLAKLEWLEQNELLSLNNDGTYVGSGGFGWSHRATAAGLCGHVRARDMWGFAESQETVGVSPTMFAEFVLPYQLPILERFGLNCYGCCEPLDARWRLRPAEYLACGECPSPPGPTWPVWPSSWAPTIFYRSSPRPATWPCPRSMRSVSEPACDRLSA